MNNFTIICNVCENKLSLPEVISDVESKGIQINHVTKFGDETLELICNSCGNTSDIIV